MDDMYSSIPVSRKATLLLIFIIPLVASWRGIDKVRGEDRRLEEAVSWRARTVDCAMAWAMASLSR